MSPPPPLPTGPQVAVAGEKQDKGGMLDLMVPSSLSLLAKNCCMAQSNWGGGGHREGRLRNVIRRAHRDVGGLIISALVAKSNTNDSWPMNLYEWEKFF